jgi:ApaG protein
MMSDKKIQVRVDASPTYLPDQSSPENHRFMWAYDIMITNESDEIIQVLTRFWKITDLRGKVEEVQGPGVIGLQPIIKPGKHFSYSSFAQLCTPQGTMEGYYEVQNLEEKRYEIEIPKFVLTCPASSHPSFRTQLH